MSPLVPLMLFGWPAFAVLLFAWLRPVRAAHIVIIGGWLLLPEASYHVTDTLAYTKGVAASLGVVLGLLLFDSRRLMTFRPSWLDLPVLLWCLVPLASSISNGLGLYDGVSEVVGQSLMWGLPYFIGRVCLRDTQDLRELAMGILLGGLLYVPLCLWEVRMAPTLHDHVYGFRQGGSWTMNERLGGYRPKVFMQNGLAVGMWMTAATLMAIWIWRIGRQHRIWGVPNWFLAGALLVTSLLCKSLGAIALMGVGIGLMYMTRLTCARLLLLIAIGLPTAYIGARTTQLWSARELVRFTGEHIDGDRANSLEDRLLQEDLFAAKALERPVFGWGGFGRMFPTDASGRRLTRGVDGMWTIFVGSNGLAGVAAWLTTMLLPAVLVVWWFPSGELASPSAAVPVALVAVLVLHMTDSLFNGMFNPVFVLAAAGLSSFVLRRGQSLREARMDVARAGYGVVVISEARG